MNKNNKIIISDKNNKNMNKIRRITIRISINKNKN